MKKVSLAKEFIKGLWEQNPVFKQVLGMCPTLAVTVSAINGIAMALATTFVLTFSSLIISLIRKLIPAQVRIASYIVVIATFVTIVDLVMKAQFPELSKALGPYIPLIVVNCIILGRQEAFSSKNGPLRSVLDSLGLGTGFLLAVLPDMYEPWLIMILPAGAFLTLGLMMGFSNAFIERKKRLEREVIIKKHLNSNNVLTINKQEG